MIGECIVARGWQRVNYIQQQFSHSVSHPGTQAAHAASSGPACHSEGVTRLVCVFYYCRTYYKAVRVGGGGEWRTCAMRDDEPRPVWMSLPITH